MSVLGKNGKCITVGIEEVSLSVTQERFSELFQDSIKELDGNLDDAFNSYKHHDEFTNSVMNLMNWMRIFHLRVHWLNWLLETTPVFVGHWMIKFTKDMYILPTRAIVSIFNAMMMKPNV